MLHKLFQTSLDQRVLNILEPAFCMNQLQIMMKSLSLVFPTKDESKETLTVKHWVREITSLQDESFEILRFELLVFKMIGTTLA